MSSTGSGWAQSRQQARALELQFANAPDIPAKPSEDEARTDAQLQELLEKREALVGQLSRLLDSESGQSAVKQNHLARHREILSDHRRDLARLKSTITDARNKANLLHNVRSDIDAYRYANPETAEAEYMLDERRRIDNSHSMADNVLSQAYALVQQVKCRGSTA
ncbi:hypothetical protein GRF29_106g108625 [Pseudopithomyces chartarum]|uniref:Uncharacterized protein n=1 Tax=Pseudopithomyces chartarum TaxID=1892770 RepID=A0AAN6RFQ1_9PLEO|nr:hypothetical protein GRF29_106g108625 [Pseudopithomyces chartarum]